MKEKVFLLGIFVFGLILRVWGINWDSGFHIHPDERMLIMVTERIHFFSQMNPDFFNYGSLPVYLLAGIAQLSDTFFNARFDSYDGLLLLGRGLSTVMDMGVLLMVYLLGKFLFRNSHSALLSTFFYAIAFFPIQNSHFFIVDTFLNFFSTLLLLSLLWYRSNPSKLSVCLIASAFSGALTSKITAIIFAPIIAFSLLLPFPTHHTIRDRIMMWIAHLRKKLFVTKEMIAYLGRVTIHGLLFGSITLLLTMVFMPYAFIEYDRFIRDVLLQVQMNSNPYVFPYTLQYVGTVPYVYYLSNIFKWGLGPIISFFAVIGLAVLITNWIFSLRKNEDRSLQFLVFVYYLLFFIIIGKSSVKFMRYLLLMYPFFALLAGYGACQIAQFTRRFINHKPISLSISYGVIGVITFLWTLPFLMIYTSPNTRVQATQWINENIPQGSVLAVEHWDDRLPMYDPGNYQYEEMTLYDIPDDARKWEILQEKLSRSDYIIIASNRLYTPLQRLQECGAHGRCYPRTAHYYRTLFSETGGFTKVAEFTSYPRIELFNKVYAINDDHADESFTVYDHPKIMIFKRK